MRPRDLPTTTVLCALLAFAPLTACTVPQLAPAQGAALIQEIDSQERDGLLTPAKAEALREAIRQLVEGEPFDWESMLYQIGGAALFALTGVRIMRGPAKPLDKSQAEVLRELVEAARKAKEAE